MEENAQQPQLEGLEPKSFYKIGEVADFLGVKPYILRYWESEFQTLSPQQTASGRHRKYRAEDVALLHQIKRLLYEEMYTIPGARKRLEELREMGALPPASPYEEGPAVASDPLEGAGVAALEQQVEMLRARLERAQKDREEALEAARVSSSALREVDAARGAAEAEARRLQAALEGSDARPVGRIAKEMEGLRGQIKALTQEREALRKERDALVLERDALQEQLNEPLPEPVPAATADPLASMEDDEGWSVDAPQQALLQAQQQVHDLQNKLRYQISNKQRLLRQIRAQAVDLVALSKGGAVVPPKLG